MPHLGKICPPHKKIPTKWASKQFQAKKAKISPKL